MANATQTPSVSLTEELIQSGTAWVILDATDTPSIPSILEEEGVEFACLYKGEAAKKYSNCAPYLARLDSVLWEWIRTRLEDEPWGILLIGDGGLDDFRDHFRRMIRVRDTKGRDLFFRFYDPRVLRSFLPTCKPSEMEDFFGPVDSIWAPLGGEDFQEFSLDKLLGRGESANGVAE